MKRLLLSAAMLLLVTAIARGETIRFDPPNATAHHSVDAIVSGIWPDGCVPSVKGVTIAGSTILLRLNTLLAPDAGCFESVTQYARTFHLEVLPAGTYTVIAVADSGDNLSELTRTPLIVRDTETLHVEPYAVPTTGGPIVIDNPTDASVASLNIGDVNVPNDSQFVSEIRANAPPHAAGAVNVVLNSADGAVTSTAALIYYDPAAADPAVFEPILYPMSFQGFGALGSQWKTENFILAGRTHAFFRDPLPCSGCSTVLGADVQLFTDDNAWGHLLYAMRGTTGTVDFASRIRDISKVSSATSGTEVPIVRERDFRGQLRFVGIQVDGRYRTSLRMWSLGDFPEYLVLIGSNPALPLHTENIPGTSMWFGSLDLTPTLLQQKTSPVSITILPSGFGSNFVPITLPPIWGMLSITSNVSQQVTIISPH
ncbi:MAG TPA: hypothetical protein VF713_16115 [Thermoanaerobaculia bacterium]